MVFFTCNACGEALKKARVEVHYTSFCRSCEFVSCIDCGKDFYGDEYKTHLKCISEAEKYQGSDYKPTENKGDVKQNSWIENVHQAISASSSTGKLREILNKILDVDNVPRKKAKFENFVKSAMKIYDLTLISQAWDVITSLQKKEQPSQAPVDSAPASAPKLSEEVKDKKLSKREKKEERSKNQTKKQKKTKSATLETKAAESDVGKISKKRKRKEATEDTADNNENKETQRCKKSNSTIRSNFDVEDELEANSDGVATSVKKMKKERKEIERNENDDKENKKLKRKRKRSNSTASANEKVNATNGVDGSDVETKKKKRKKHAQCEGDQPVLAKKKKKIVQSEENDAVTTSSVDESLHENPKFSWNSIFVKVLKDNDGELSVKKLRKKVLAAYLGSSKSGHEDTEVQLWAKFAKKLSKNSKIRVHKERAKLLQ